MRCLGLDYGTVRVGVAISDPLGSMARPYSVAEAKPLEKLCAVIAKICAEEEVETIVIGLPRHMNGDEGSSSAAARAMGAALEKTLPKVKFVYRDERLSTLGAGKLMIDAEFSSAKRKKIIDSAAAAVILQDYLDSVSG